MKALSPTTGTTRRQDYRSFRAGLVVLLIVTAAGCTGNVTEDDLLGRARHSRAEGEHSAAMLWLKKAIEREPQNTEARYLMAESYADIGDLLSAQEELNKAAALGLAKDRSLPLLGRLLLRLEKYQQLLSELDAQELAPAVRAEIALLRGQAYLALGMFEKARNAFKSALPTREADVTLGLARAAILQQDLDSADRLLAEALRLDPKSGEAWLVKGDLLRIRSRAEESLTAYKQSLAVQPRAIAPLLSMVSLFISLGKYDQARELLDSARKLAPADVRVQFADALLSFHQGRYESCLAPLARVFALIPDHAPSILLSGNVSLAMGELRQAQYAFSAYLERFPASTLVRRMLAATLLRKGESQDAVYVLEPLLKPDHLDRELLNLAGEAYLQIGEMEKAQHYLQRALDADPSNLGVRTTVGLIWLALGDSQRASTYLEEAVRLNSAEPQLATLLVMALISQNAIDRAFKVVATVEQKWPNRPATYQLKGAMFLAMQNIASARASFERALSLQATYFPAAAALAELDLRQNDFNAARGRMQAILSKDRTHLGAMLTIASLEASMGRRTEAIELLRNAVADHPTAVQAYLQLSQLELESGKAKEALRAALNARNISPYDPQVWEALGRAQMASGDNSRAITSFKKVVLALPTSVPSLLSLGAAYSANGDDRAAIEIINKAVELKPSALEISVALGTAYVRAKRFADALSLAQEIKKQFPDLAHGYALEGDTYMTKQDYRLAADAYRKADKIQSTGTLRVRLYEAQRRANSATADSTPLVQWVEAHKNDADTRLYLANAFLKTGQTESAVVQYEALLRIDPKDYRVLNNIAWALASTKDARSLDYAYQAYQVDADNPAIADTLGWLLIEHGKLYEGTAVLQKAAAKNPLMPELRLHLVEAWVRAGQNALARKELDDVIRSNKGLDQRDDVRRLLGRLAALPKASGKGAGAVP